MIQVRKPYHLSVQTILVLFSHLTEVMPTIVKVKFQFYSTLVRTNLSSAEEVPWDVARQLLIKKGDKSRAKHAMYTY